VLRVLRRNGGDAARALRLHLESRSPEAQLLALTARALI
jgi:hypothetical protein